MLRLTKQADYGIVLMTRMTDEVDRLFTANELATATGIPQPMVAKILKVLNRSDLLTSQRGAKGGYSLARPPAEITVAEMIAALEGPIAFTECIDDTPGTCSQEAVCRLRTTWQHVNAVLRQALGSISLADLAQPPTPLVQLRLGSQSTTGQGNPKTVEQSLS